MGRRVLRSIIEVIVKMSLEMVFVEASALDLDQQVT
jgi:hypothetical protein